MCDCSELVQRPPACAHVCMLACTCALARALALTLMQGLAEHWESQQSKDLRTSMRLQWACMQDQALPGYPAHQAVCKRWVKCLKDSLRFGDIFTILQARGASKAPPLPQLAAKGSSNGAENLQDLQLDTRSQLLLADIKAAKSPCQIFPCDPVSLLRKCSGCGIVCSVAQVCKEYKLKASQKGILCTPDHICLAANERCKTSIAMREQHAKEV